MTHKHFLPRWHRGIHAVHFGFLSGLVAMVFIAALSSTIISPLWVKQADAAVSNFAAGGFWNTRVPSYTGLHPDSAGLVQDIVRQVGQYGTGFVKDSGASPVYIAEPGAAAVSVVPWDCGTGIPADLANQWQAVPVPFYAVPSGGANPQMIVYQPSSATVWEFGHMRNISGQWQACTGGRISTTSDGVFPAPYGVSSSRLAALAGQISIQELQAGEINHVMGLNMPQTNGVTWPATQSGGSVAGTPPMGLRLRLDPSVNVQALGLNSVGTAIARAAQTYGFVVWNRGGSVGVTAENPSSITVRGLPDPYNNLSTAGALSAFPWDKLQALPADYGETADVPAIMQFSASSTSARPDTTIALHWQANNVTLCTIPGLADNLPASGSFTTPRLKVSTTFVLRCGGPLGTASSQVSVSVPRVGTNDPLPVLAPSVIVDLPYSGYANIIDHLMSPEAAEQIYKVVYYEQQTYLFETAKPPFALNTSRMENGKHTVNARLYYRDGRIEEKGAGITVNNSPETLFATTQSGVIKAPPSIPAGWAALGLFMVAVVMCVGSWWGYHRAHLLN